MATPVTKVMPRTGRGTEATTEAGRARPFEWSTAIERFESGGWFWLGTVRPDGRPHSMPCFAAWSGSSFFVASKGATQKSRNLDTNGSCALTTDAGDAHLIIEGHAQRVTDADGLARASQAMQRLYGWPTTVAGDELDAKYGAPTSGGPPYRVYEITPKKGFALPTDGESFAPTRWRFEEPADRSIWEK